jgi:hypothetical protein
MNTLEALILTLAGQGWESGRLYSGGTGIWRTARRHRLTGWLQVQLSDGRWTSILPRNHRWRFMSDADFEG